MVQVRQKTFGRERSPLTDVVQMHDESTKSWVECESVEEPLASSLMFAR